MTRLRFIVGGAVIGAGLLYLVAAGFRQSTSTHLTLASFAAGPRQFEGQRLQIGGCNVVSGSIVWDQYRHRPQFAVADDKYSLRVRYTGNTVLPDTFKDDAVVVMEGYYDVSTRQFQAQVVFAKCPSKYEGESYDSHVAAQNSGSG